MKLFEIKIDGRPLRDVDLTVSQGKVRIQTRSGIYDMDFRGIEILEQVVIEAEDRGSRARIELLVA